MSTVGLPRSLLYYHYAPLWRAFFQALGIDVVISPPTTAETLARGAARVVSETCLPVKVYCGHVLSLAGQVDCVFVPAIHRLRAGTRNCPKLIGLPDLIAGVVPKVPTLSVDIEDEGGWPPLAPLALQLSRYWRINPLSFARAVEEAQAAGRAYQALLLGGMDAPWAIELPAREGGPAAGSLTVAVVGHPYNLYDDYTTHRLLDRLREMDVRVRTPESVPPADRWASVERLCQAPYWTYEDEVVGAAGSLVEAGVDGIISISAFGCAPDSVMLAVLDKAARHADVPHMALILDEHSGETGLITRLEAFVDMLHARALRRKEIA